MKEDVRKRSEKNKKNPNFICRAWERFYKHPEFIKFSKDEESIRRNPNFLSELQKLKEEFPLGDHPASGTKCRQVFFPNKKTEEAWNKYSNKWALQLQPLIWGYVQKEWPISMMEKGKKLFKTYGYTPTEQQSRAFLPVELLYVRLSLGQHQSNPGRKEDIERNKNMRSEFKARRKKKEATEDIISSFTIKHDLSEDRVRRIIHSRKND